MRVLITGATGTIGRAAVAELIGRGDSVVALTRDPARGRQALGEGVEVHRWASPNDEAPPAEALRGVDGILHLLGEPVAQRWSDEAKSRIRDSRVKSTRHLVTALQALPADAVPRVLVSQSATGFYGPRGDQTVDESTPAGHDFLAEVTVAWEKEAASAQDRTRVALTRTGVVLSPDGGALAKMLPFFRLGIGGPVAGGGQYVPWIHLDDVVGALLHCLVSDDVSGPVNVTAPNPVTNTELSKALGHALRRPAVLPVPALAIKALYGEMAEMVTTGQRAIPTRLIEAGYDFRHPEIEPALRDVLSSS